MHNDKKNRRLYDKKFKVTYASNVDRLKYDRAYVKKQEASWLPFSRTCRESKWHDDWSNDCKRDDYITKYIEKQVGRPVSEVYSEFCRFGWKSKEMRRECWDNNVSNGNVAGRRRYNVEVNEDGKLAWTEGDYRQHRRPWHRDKTFVPKYVLSYNDKQRIPDFGFVRDAPVDNRNGALKDTSMKTLPGKWYVKYKDKWILLHIYVFPSKPFINANSYMESYAYWKKYHREFCKKLTDFNNNFKNVSVFQSNGIIKHVCYGEYEDHVYNRETDNYQTIRRIGNLGYGTLYTYVSIKEAERVWNQTNE